MSEFSLTQATPRCIAGIGAFRDRAALQAALSAEFGTEVPTNSAFVLVGGVMISCLSPLHYLASADRGADLPARLSRSLAGVAAITDQSDQWEIFIIAGKQVREVLARMVPIDVDPAVFRIGHLALTRGAHRNVRLWRVGESTYELAVTRSYAAGFRHFLAREEDVLF